MTARTPTASGISRLLKQANFSRSESMGRSGRSTGFKVTSDYTTGCVKVEFVTWSMGASSNPDYVQEKLSQYAEEITGAGYEVLRPSPRWIIVTAKDED